MEIGNLAQWAQVGVTIIVGIIIALYIHFKNKKQQLLEAAKYIRPCLSVAYKIGVKLKSYEYKECIDSLIDECESTYYNSMIFNQNLSCQMENLVLKLKELKECNDTEKKKLLIILEIIDICNNIVTANY